jgi:hypothetical protein
MIYSADTILGILLLGIILASTIPAIPYVKMIYAIKSLKFTKMNYEAAVNSYYFTSKTNTKVSGIFYKLTYNKEKLVYDFGQQYAKRIDNWITTPYAFNPHQYSCKAQGCGCSKSEYTYYLIESSTQEFPAFNIYPEKIDQIEIKQSQVKGHV